MPEGRIAPTHQHLYVVACVSAVQILQGLNLEFAALHGSSSVSGYTSIQRGSNKSLPAQTLNDTILDRHLAMGILQHGEVQSLSVLKERG